MNINNSHQLDSAREAISRGDKKGAQQILAGILNQDSQNTEAWLLLADILDNPQHRIDCLKRVLQINPSNVIARRRLDELMGGYNKSTIKQQTAQIKSPNAQPKAPRKKNNTWIIVFGALFLVACGCIALFYFIGSMGSSLSSPSSTTSTGTSMPQKPLSDLALNKSEIEFAIQNIAPLTVNPPQDSCNIPTSLQCYETGYTSSEGDVLILVLARFSSPSEASNFGTGVKVQKEQIEHATDLNLPTTAGNYRWLDSGFISGAPMYYGGANENNVAILIEWGRTSVFVSQDEAIQTFSRLLDAQLNKLR